MGLNFIEYLNYNFYYGKLYFKEFINNLQSFNYKIQIIMGLKAVLIYIYFLSFKLCDIKPLLINVI